MNRKREKKGEGDRNTPLKRSVSERIGSILDIPADLLSGGCYMEMRGQNELTLQGCRQIEVYTPEQIVLRLRRGEVRICGRRMTCTSYHGGCAVIEGWIVGVEFSNGEETS